MRGELLVFLTVFAGLASAAFAAEPKAPVPKEGVGLTTPAPHEINTSVVKILRTTNKAQVNQYVCKVFDLKNVNPYDMLCFPEVLAQTEEGMLYTFVHPDGDKGKILVVCPEYQLPSFEQQIKQLDREKLFRMQKAKYAFYRAKHRSANELVPVSRYYSASSDRLRYDPETNSFLFHGVPSGWEAVEAAMVNIDQPTPQALIEVTIYDVQLNNDGTFGLDFHAWKNGPGRALGAAGVRFQWLGINKDASAPVHTNAYHGRSHHGQGFFLDYPSAYFDALVEKGKAKVLTQTKLATMNNQTASFATGENVPFYEITQDDVLDRKVTGTLLDRVLGRHPTPLIPPGDQAIRAVHTGVFLEVTPIINEQLVEMDIAARVVTLLGYDDRGQPLLSSRQFSDNAQVRSGDELIIGGLTRERKVKTTRKIPILGSLPILGWVFGGEITTAQKTMTVAVVRPIVKEFRSPVTSEDRQIVDQANGRQAIPLPEPPFGFDQWLFDRDQ